MWRLLLLRDDYLPRRWHLLLQSKEADIVTDPSQTYYDVLGISPSASLDEIKQAFRQLARRYHPDLNPDNQQALQRFQEISVVYQVLSDPVARQHYDQCLSGQGGNSVDSVSERTAAEWYQKGVALSQRGQYEEAIASYTNALTRNPAFVDAYNQRGFAYYKVRNSAEAFADYIEAIKLDDQQATSYYYRGLTRFSLGYINAAIADYTQAIQRRPNHGQAYYHRGLAYADINENRLAMADFKQAEEQFVDQGNAQLSSDARLAYRKIVQQHHPLAALSHAFFSPSDAFMVLYRVCLNPIGGGIAAFDSLTPPRALAVGLLLGFWFALCFTYGIAEVVSRRVDIDISFIVEVLGLGSLMFVGLIFSSAFARILFRQTGNVSSDIFIAGVALLPLSVASLGIGHISGISSLIFTVICLGYMVLTLYGECRYILHLEQKIAAVWVSIMVLVSLLPLSVLR